MALPTKKRKCSLCRKLGHTKRNCQNTFLSDKKKDTPFVRVKTEPLESPHVVNLRLKDDKTPLAEVLLYREKKPERGKRQIVNFAELIRQNNERKNHVTVLPKEEPAKSIVPLKKKKKFIQISVRSIHHRVKAFGQAKAQSVRETWQNALVGGRGALSILVTKKFVYRLAVFLTILALPFPSFAYYQQVKKTSERVAEESTNGFLSLQASTLAALQSNVPKAEYDLSLALASFSAASNILDEEHQVLQYVTELLPVVGPEVKSRQNILTAGHHLALGNTYLIKGVDEAAHEEAPLTDRLMTLRHHLQGAAPQYKEALKSLETVDEKVIPVEYQQSFAEFKLLFATFIDDLQNLTELIDSMNVIFGGNDFRRYLVMFQNDDELRPTGGFMGSYAIVDVQKGKILRLEIPPAGTYDVQGQLSEYVKPPLPLQLVTNRWEFQDANWWPDFPASAQKIEWFYEHSRGTTIDGVIAVNAKVLERLLPVVGTLESQTAGVTLDSSSDLSALQYEVEVGYDKEENAPKAVVGELFQSLMEKLQNLKTLDVIQLLGVLHTSLEEKDVQVFMNDKNVEATLGQYGWTGEVVLTESGQDYLMVVQTNILGQKSDARIEQQIDHQAVVQPDGSIVDTVVVRRTHTGSPTEQFYGSKNPSYVRFYVPAGATLLEAKGFMYPPEEAFTVPEKWYEEDDDIARQETFLGIDPNSGTTVSQSFGKTVFGNWMITEPGQTSEVYIVYKLPFESTAVESLNRPPSFATKLFSLSKSVSSRYSLVVGKQSGIESDFSTQVIYGDLWHPVWKSDDMVELAENGARFETKLNTDKIFGVVMQKEEK